MVRWSKGNEGVAWREFELRFKATEEEARQAFDYLVSINGSSPYKNEVEDLELEHDEYNDDWVILYGCDKRERGPAQAVNKQFPKLKVKFDQVGEHYD